MGTDPDDALARLSAAFPSAGPLPAGFVEAVGTCDQGPALRSRALRDQDVAGGDVLDALALVRWARGSLDTSERRLIDAARDRGASWKEIAAALGLDSPQGAQRRHERLAKPLRRRRS